MSLLELRLARACRYAREKIFSFRTEGADGFNVAALNPRDFEGACGFAQCAIKYALVDFGVVPEQAIVPIATQQLEGWWYGHASLLVEASQDRHFVVDPTFVQFIALSDAEDTPAAIMERSPIGRAVLDPLVEHGFFEARPPTLELYSRAFCRGAPPFSSHNEALDFFRNAPPHAFHFQFAKGDNRFSRTNLEAAGLLLPQL